MPENRWNRIADLAAEQMKRTVEQAGVDLRGGTEPALHHVVTEAEKQDILRTLTDPNAPPQAVARARQIVHYQFDVAERARNGG